MKNTWTVGVKTPQEKDAIILEYKASPILRERLYAILQGKRMKALDENVKDAGYDSPNWAYKQADNVGYMRALKEISDLLQ